ncbi:MAG: hypothetical protein U0941_16010 [Planctomycetaceae bacterium]
MNEKIRPQALEKLAGKSHDEPVSFTLRITTPLSQEQIDLLIGWGGKLLYDSGIMAILTIPASRAEELAELETVLEII